MVLFLGLPGGPGQDRGVNPLDVRDPSSPSFCGRFARRDPRPVSARGHRMAVPALRSMAYAGGGREVGFPRPSLPVVCRGRWCSGRGTGVMSGRRAAAGGSSCPRLRCAPPCGGESCRCCPAFTLAWRLDVAEGTIGSVLAGGGRRRVRGPPRRRTGRGLPYTTARGWVPPVSGPAAREPRGGGSRRWSVELGGAGGHAAGRGRARFAAGRRSTRAFAGAAGLARVGPAGAAWRFASAVTRREADRRQTQSRPGLWSAGRAFHASYPAMTGVRGGRAWITTSKSRSRCTGGR